MGNLISRLCYWAKRKKEPLRSWSRSIPCDLQDQLRNSVYGSVASEASITQLDLGGDGKRMSGCRADSFLRWGSAMTTKSHYHLPARQVRAAREKRFRVRG